MGTYIIFIFININILFRQRGCTDESTVIFYRQTTFVCECVCVCVELMWASEGHKDNQLLGGLGLEIGGKEAYIV